MQVVFQDENCSSSYTSDTSIPNTNRNSAFSTAPKRALGDITNVAKGEKSNLGKKVSHVTRLVYCRILKNFKRYPLK